MRPTAQRERTDRLHHARSCVGRPRHRATPIALASLAALGLLACAPTGSPAGPSEAPTTEVAATAAATPPANPVAAPPSTGPSPDRATPGNVSAPPAAAPSSSDLPLRDDAVAGLAFMDDHPGPHDVGESCDIGFEVVDPTAPTLVAVTGPAVQDPGDLDALADLFVLYGEPVDGATTCDPLSFGNDGDHTRFGQVEGGTPAFDDGHGLVAFAPADRSDIVLDAPQDGTFTHAAMAPGRATLTVVELVPVNADNIVGQWFNGDDEPTFRADGTFVLNDRAGTWEVPTDGTLVIVNDDAPNTEQLAHVGTGEFGRVLVFTLEDPRNDNDAVTTLLMTDDPPTQ